MRGTTSKYLKKHAILLSDHPFFTLILYKRLKRMWKDNYIKTKQWIAEQHEINKYKEVSK